MKPLARLVLACARLSVGVEERKKRTSSKKASERKTAGVKLSLPSPHSVFRTFFPIRFPHYLRALNRLDWFKAPFTRLRVKATWCQKYANWCGRGLFNNTLFCILSFQASCPGSRREIMECSVRYGSYRCRQQVVGTSLPLRQVKESSYFSFGKLKLFHHPFLLLKSARIVLFPAVVRTAGKIFPGLKCECRKLRISVSARGTANYFDLSGWVSTVKKTTQQWKSTFSGEQIGRGMQLICAPFPPAPGIVFSY